MKFHDTTALRYSFNFFDDFVYQIKIPIHYYKLVFSKVENMSRFDELFNPQDFLSFSDDKKFALITFNALDRNHRKSIALPRWFHWLNLGPENFSEPIHPIKYQTGFIDFSCNDIVLSFMRWTQSCFLDNKFKKTIIDNITHNINVFGELYTNKKRSPLIPQFTFEDKFMIYMYSNGLHLGGDYNDITTHNCDTSFQKFRFIVVSMEIIKELQKNKPAL